MRPLEEKGVNIVFLPRYSPDLNPIELAWSKVKAYLRRAKARSVDELCKAMSEALDTISTDNAKG
jgi:transposase